MNTYNVVVTVSTTVCIDAESPDDAIEKVSQALNNGDANMSADVANNIGYSIRNGHYEVTDAIPMDEDYDEGSGNEEDDESEEWEQHNRREGNFYPIMEFLHSADEQLLREDIRRYDIKPTVIRTKDEMHEFYRTQPDEMILAALVEVDDKDYTTFSIATDPEAVKCLKAPLKKGGYNFEERKAFWDSFFDFKAPKLRLPVEITKPSGKDGIAQ